LCAGELRRRKHRDRHEEATARSRETD
jgi:hypothetical protein